MFSVEIDQAAVQAAKTKLLQTLQARMEGACVAAAGKLAGKYREVLLEIQAPPHSPPGMIPRRYDGYREGGWGGLSRSDVGVDPGVTPFSDAEMQDVFNAQFDPSTSFETGEFAGRIKNNKPPEFSKVQGDDEFLATFITHGSTDGGGVVGFTAENSHVTSREQNYLIQHDQGKVPAYPDVERPWVDEIYDSAKPEMVVAFQNYLDTGGTDSVPF